MKTKEITIEGIGPVSIRKRAGSHSIRLSLQPDGSVRVSQPSWLPFKAGEAFARSRADWINANKKQPTGTLRHGQHIGKSYRLSLEPHSNERVTTRIAGLEVRISYPLGMEPTSPAVQRAATRASIRALRAEAARELLPRLKALAEQHGFTYQSASVKQLKSRWGSCDSQQHITLNIFLMQLPWHLIDYVLLHELVHTRHMEHGPHFWGEFERHLADPKALRKAMKQYQPILVPTGQ